MRILYFASWYRALLKAEVEKHLPKLEKITGLYCSSWQSKYMTTRWGTCNTNTRKIWLNLQLAKKPIECLEYVILHELAHLKVRNHGAEFIAILDQHMSYWRDLKKQATDQVACSLFQPRGVHQIRSGFLDQAGNFLRNLR